RSNPLGDPAERPLWVWSPQDRSRRYPTIYVLHAHMRSAHWWFNVEPFERSYPETVDVLAPEAVVVLVDGWTSVGGSQWIDSAGIHRRGDALLVELGSAALAFGDGTLPIELETATLVPEAWGRWREHDPVRIAGSSAEAAAGLRGVWLDAGRSDEYFLDLGALALRQALREAGLAE